jgi:hypothetical protein
MDELLAKNALDTAGRLEETSSAHMVYTINGHSKTVSSAPLSKVLRAVCKHHAVWLLNNLGKAVLDLPEKHRHTRPDCHGKLDVTADDVACFKAVLGALGSTVQIAERFVIVDGSHVNVKRKSTTLRIGELLYIYYATETDGDSTAITVLACQAALELIPRIFERGEQIKAKAKEAEKKLQKKAKAAASRETKKRRIQEAASSSTRDESHFTQQNE